LPLDAVRWFVRRYPSARERLAYVRRAWKAWTRPVRIVPGPGREPGQGA
jgi:hypothetical protein